MNHKLADPCTHQTLLKVRRELSPLNLGFIVEYSDVIILTMSKECTGLRLGLRENCVFHVYPLNTFEASLHRGDDVGDGLYVVNSKRASNIE
jgi:hypothetical protein